jgi:hypothetical protein
VKILWKLLMRFGATMAAAAGVDPSGSVLGDFPVPWGGS